MFALSDDDLLLIKFMVFSTLRVENVKKAKQFDEIVDLLTKECGKDLSDNIIDEALFYLNCLNILHLRNVCSERYENSEWGIDIGDEVILFVRLFQMLDHDDFANMLETCTDITLEEFQYLELDIEFLDDKNYIEDIIKWLKNHKYKFAENVEKMLDLRKLKNDVTISGIADESLIPISNDQRLEQRGNSSPMITDEAFDVTPTDCKGICVVISNEIFEPKAKDSLLPRNGTKKDEENIKTTFSSLGYDVQIYQNATYDCMLNIIEKTKQSASSSHRMLIVFILTHGIRKCILTTDNKEMPFEDIWMPFNNRDFAKLSGKPKLFFFACCQGSNLNLGVPVSNIEWDSPEDLVPEVCQFFIGYATCDTFLSCRTQKGTYYVKYLCKVIRKYPDALITDIHQELQTRLSSLIINKKEKGGMGFQMPCYHNMLTANVSFIDSENT